MPRPATDFHLGHAELLALTDSRATFEDVAVINTDVAVTAVTTNTVLTTDAVTVNAVVAASASTTKATTTNAVADNTADRTTANVEASVRIGEKAL